MEQLEPSLGAWLAAGAHSDVTLRILGHVRSQDLPAVAATCRAMHLLTANDSLWRVRLAVDFGLVGRHARPPLPPLLRPDYASTAAEQTWTSDAKAAAALPAPLFYDHHHAGDDAGEGAEPQPAVAGAQPGAAPPRDVPTFAEVLQPALAAAAPRERAVPLRQIYRAWCASGTDTHSGPVVPPMPSAVRARLEADIAAGREQLPAGLPTVSALWAHLVARMWSVWQTLYAYSPYGEDLPNETTDDVPDELLATMPLAFAAILATRPPHVATIGHAEFYDQDVYLRLAIPSMLQSLRDLQAKMNLGPLFFGGPGKRFPLALALRHGLSAVIVYEGTTGTILRVPVLSREVLRVENGPACPFSTPDAPVRWLEELARRARVCLIRGVREGGSESSAVELFSNEGPEVARSVTRGVEARVCSVLYHEDEEQFAFTYKVYLRLLPVEPTTVADGEAPILRCQLQRRHWVVRDGHGVESHVSYFSSEMAWSCGALACVKEKQGAGEGEQHNGRYVARDATF